ncbi:MAG: hypothetical protein KKB81_04215 [Candidatus Margulisbacteria bacterium]|nr:hypothetical protein [Candidatus Margulisiibacteriota bacterium]MBU1021950.1 hypothetical protein [Candidatus Margulisiibacteriota bacterium]MBU1728929.1 hypothetical protein [Candidatus Margulisiibacteriota bacterium]MBU1954735.1 hypothetical protein [Candidatus Margulisiibacteriota bacterium]
MTVNARISLTKFRKSDRALPNLPSPKPGKGSQIIEQRVEGQGRKLWREGDPLWQKIRYGVPRLFNRHQLNHGLNIEVIKQRIDQLSDLGDVFDIRVEGNAHKVVLLSYGSRTDQLSAILREIGGSYTWFFSGLTEVEECPKISDVIRSVNESAPFNVTLFGRLSTDGIEVAERVVPLDQIAGLEPLTPLIIDRVQRLAYLSERFEAVEKAKETGELGPGLPLMNFTEDTSFIGYLLEIDA